MHRGNMDGSKWGLDISFFRTFFLMHLLLVLLLDDAVGGCNGSHEGRVQ